MYLRQIGFLPKLTSSIGFWVFGFGFLAAALNIYRGPLGDTSLGITIGYTVCMLVIFVPLMLAGLGIAGLFPDIRVNEKGVHYQYFFFVKGSIRWDEIDELVEIARPENCLALAVSRGYSSLIVDIAFFFNYFYGFMVGHQHPVLLIHASLEQRDVAVSEIKKQVETRKNR